MLLDLDKLNLLNSIIHNVDRLLYPLRPWSRKQKDRRVGTKKVGVLLPWHNTVEPLFVCSNNAHDCRILKVDDFISLFSLC